MRTSKLFLLIAALCTAVPSLMGQVPVNVDPNQSAGLQKFFLVPESVLAQIPHQNKIIPIPQNVVSSPPGTGVGQNTFHSQNSHQNPNKAALTPDQAQQAKAQEDFRNQVIQSNKKAIAQRQEPIAASNQFTPTAQFSQNDQFSSNQQQDSHQHSQQQVHPHTQQVQTPTPAKRVVKPQRQKNVQRPIEQGVNQVSQQQQFQQPRVHHPQSQQPIVQHQFQQPQVQQVQQPQVQQQQFAPSPQFQQPQQSPVQIQPSPATQRHQHDQVQQHPTSFLSNQPSAESQRRPFDTRSQAIRDEDDIIRQQAENAKYSFSSSVNDGINDQQNYRQETRDGLKLAGLYSYSDGYYKRTIHYEADENGYRVTNEESEPIGNGPNSDPSGVAEVASDVGGASVRYSISGQDFPHSVFTPGNEQGSSNNFQRK